MKEQQKKSNPLYHVSSNGEVVEEAKSVLDLMIKKLGLEKAIEFIVPYLNEFMEQFIQQLLKNIESYPMFMAAKSLFDQFIDKLVTLILEVQHQILKKT